jgi:phage replication O-like protein O
VASPQTENGYTKIANELLEALIRNRISGENMMVLLAIIRQSYGYSKKIAQISLGQISNLTNLDRRNVNRAKKKLLEMNLIKQHKKGYINSYSLNKNYETWKTDVKNDDTSKCRQKRRQGVVKNDDKSVVKNDTPLKKERKYKESKSSLSEIEKQFPIETKIVNYFISTLDKKLYPNDNQKIEWILEIEKCYRLNGYQYEEIEKIISIFRKDKFWEDKFLSPLKLRRQNKDGVTYIAYFWQQIKGKVQLKSSEIPESSDEKESWEDG